MTVAAVADTNWLEPEKLYLRFAPDCETDRPVFQGDVFRTVTLPQLPNKPVPPGPSEITFVESLCMVVPHPCQCYHGDDIRPRLTVASVRPVHDGHTQPPSGTRRTSCRLGYAATGL